MGYDVAIHKAWEDLARLNPVRNLDLQGNQEGISNGVNPAKNISLKFLADEYVVDLDAR